MQTIRIIIIKYTIIIAMKKSFLRKNSYSRDCNTAKI